MKINKWMLALPLAAALFVAGHASANAQVGLLILADNYIKKQSKVAANTPGHTAWCARKHAGYRKEWNSYPRGNGRRRHCASPYYTPPWMKKGQ